MDDLYLSQNQSNDAIELTQYSADPDDSHAREDGIAMP